MKRWHVLAACAVALLALVWFRAASSDRTSTVRRSVPHQRVQARVDAPQAAESPPPQAATPADPAAAPTGPETIVVVDRAAPAPTVASRFVAAPGEEAEAAWVRIVAAELTEEERRAVDRHLTRFVRAPAAATGGADAPPDSRTPDLTAETAPLPKADTDGSEKHRVEQLELLRQRKAIVLLDHIDAGLAWLALHQGPDGKISDSAAADRCAQLGHKPACTGAWADDQFAVAVTGLSVIAFLDFRDQDKQGLFEPTLARAVSWLRARQQANGAFPGRAHYTAAIALLALGQAASSSGSEELRESVRLGLAHLASQAGGDGGYRYETAQPGDLSVTAWVAQAVEAARRAKVEVPAGMEEGMRRFLDAAWLGGHRFAYVIGPGERPSLAPAGMLLALIERDVPCPHGSWACSGDAVAETWRRWLEQPPPKALYTLYYGVRVAILLEEGLPDSWRQAIVDLAGMQEREGAATGAFRSVRLQGAGGAALQTAFATLTLEHALYKR